MSGTLREVPRGLSESHVVRLFKCAVKDDDSLVDAIVEKLYRTMRDFDAGRAKQTVELIVDRDTPQSWERCSTTYGRSALRR